MSKDTSILLWIFMVFQTYHYNFGLPTVDCDEKYESSPCPAFTYYDFATTCCHNCWDLCDTKTTLSNARKCQKLCKDYITQKSTTSPYSSDVLPKQSTESFSRFLQPKLKPGIKEHWHIAIEVTLIIAFMVVILLLSFSCRTYKQLESKYLKLKSEYESVTSQENETSRESVNSRESVTSQENVTSRKDRTSWYTQSEEEQTLIKTMELHSNNTPVQP